MWNDDRSNVFVVWNTVFEIDMKHWSVDEVCYVGIFVLIAVFGSHL
jgi:hypothetical protein